MNICVFGLWHLGTVTAACLANVGFRVIGLDGNAPVIEQLKQGHAPIYEPGLDELLAQGLAGMTLDFTTDPVAALSTAEVLWVTFDTPVNADDEADVAWVQQQIEAILEYIPVGTKIIISSQVPVGFTRHLEQFYAQRYPAKPVKFAYSPENLRLGKALQTFSQPDRIVIGIRTPADRDDFQAVFTKITDRLEWMQTESAEMTKHGINAFLAASVAFANELATLCEAVGADAKEVARGIKTDSRIGPRAYLNPGSAYAGGTLARDIQFLMSLGQRYHQATYLFNAVKQSNDHHNDWAKRVCAEYFPDLTAKIISILGLTYKPGTDTLRRSWAIELAEWLTTQGAFVQAFDPQVKSLPEHLMTLITLKPTVAEAVAQADGVVIATDWPQFRDVDEAVLALMRHQVVIDPNGLLEQRFARYSDMNYRMVGRKRI